MATLQPLLWERLSALVTYYKQHQNYTCGPTAILNAFRFQGHDNDLSEIRKLERAVNCHFPKGTCHFDINDFLLHNKIANHFIRFPTLAHINRTLKQGHAILINILYDNSDDDSVFRNNRFLGHYALLVGTTKQFFYAVNIWMNKPALVRIKHSKFKRLFLKHKRVPNSDCTKKYPIGWIIKRGKANSKTH